MSVSRLVLTSVFALWLAAACSSTSPDPATPQGRGGAAGEGGHGGDPPSNAGPGGAGGDEGDGGDGGGGPACGNGVLDPGEACDHGAANSDTEPDACRKDCTKPSCGDGVVDDLYGEACDEGKANSDEPDAPCRSDCRLPTCGDGIVDKARGETCDEGKAGNSDEAGATCRTNCRLAGCGDGLPDSGEACDDGIHNSDDIPNACRTDCSLPRCGDGVVDSSEGCDAGASNGREGSACRADCTACGDGWLDFAHGEACDHGLNNSDFAPSACRTNCQPHACGDGVIDTDEDCEKGNLGPHDCQSLGYGGGTLSCTENTCRFITDACTGGPLCGDGIRQLPYEQCDDGNLAAGDGCAHNCHLEQTGACGSMIDLSRLWGARPIGNTSITVGGSTLGEGDALKGDSCGRAYPTGEDVTYAFWVASDSQLVLKLLDKSSPPAKHTLLIRRNCAAPATQLACAQSLYRLEHLGAKVEVPVDANTQLYLTVDTEDGGGGNFELTLTVTGR